MNCLEYRRSKLSDPRRLPAEAQAHELECAQCARFAREVDDTDASVAEALAVRVPEGLAERVLLRRRPARWRWTPWALGAGLALAVAAVVHPFKPNASEQYARLAIEHVVMEPESLTTERGNDPTVVGAALRSFGGTMKEPIGPVRYVRLCPVEGGTGLHIVFETPEGLATLILVPDKRIAAAAVADAAGWDALVQPAPRGYYAVVTASRAGTIAADRLIRQRIDWST
jgi:Protein of unknown function (DUF3379)